MSEACGLELDDINWDLGRFGKLHVRHGKGARGSGPRERMVPLINGADRTLRWFFEDVWGQFDADHTRPGAPLFPSERKNTDGSARRVGDDAHGHQRHDQLVALRSLFSWAKRNGLIFRNPTSRIKVEVYEYAVLQPLVPEQVDGSVAAATTPATRRILALAAGHAARVANLMLDDADLGNRRLTIAKRARTLDELTLQLLLDWLEHRRRRWPTTANLHLLINNQTANTTSRASNHWISAPTRGQEATLERLRVDRQLEEAMVRGPDPLHLAEVFGLDEKTAMRYADSARALLEQAAQQMPESRQ
ncbi:hypothetical protein OKJ48_13460 [Streptomyces kunmingensis]|uniref:Integrase n=1 Tax=Streptomyces kunmingensis TaxID=68225 RepID=A0ABU6CAQ2_9ACTN|nr:hypothetical protein [Streptomyces kunmingensis]MEB3961247.1 hypothetical protein [Streptomyces kunmingensis]